MVVDQNEASFLKMSSKRVTIVKFFPRMQPYSLIINILSGGLYLNFNVYETLFAFCILTK